MATAFLFPSGGATLILPWLIGLRVWRQMAQRGARWVHSVLDVPLATFLVLALVAGLHSPLPGVALGNWVLAALAFVIVPQAALDGARENPAFVRGLYWAFALGTLCASIYGLLVFHLQHTYRAQLLTLGPNALGLGLAAGILLSAPLLEESFLRPMISATTIALALVCAIATLSREALYVLAAGGLTYICMAGRKLALRFLSVILLSLGLGLFAVVAMPSIRSSLALQLRNQNLAGAPSAGAGTAVLWKTMQFVFSRTGNSDRLSTWQFDMRIIRDRPWFGVGLGVFPFVAPQWREPGPHSVREPDGLPHNIYLDTAVEVGIPGAVAFVAMPLAAIWWAARYGGANRHAALAAMVGMLVGEIRDTILIGLHMALGFVLILAVLAAPVPRQATPP